MTITCASKLSTLRQNNIEIYLFLIFNNKINIKICSQTAEKLILYSTFTIMGRTHTYDLTLLFILTIALYSLDSRGSWRHLCLFQQKPTYKTIATIILFAVRKRLIRNHETHNWSHRCKYFNHIIFRKPSKILHTKKYIRKPIIGTPLSP